MNMKRYGRAAAGNRRMLGHCSENPMLARTVFLGIRKAEVSARKNVNHLVICLRTRRAKSGPVKHMRH